MTQKLTQKEQAYLTDAKSWEKMCVTKYTKYANQAQDPELKQIFQQIAQAEQNHQSQIEGILQKYGVNPNQMQ